MSFFQEERQRFKEDMNDPSVAFAMAASPFLLLFIGLYFGADISTTFFSGPTPGRLLAADEKKIIDGIFGDRINSSAIEIVSDPAKARMSASTHNDRLIVYSSDTYSPDFTTETDFEKWSSIFHEATHVWQFQTQWRYTPDKYCWRYEYALSPTSVFTNFCTEQQASIIADYANRFISKQKFQTIRYANEGVQNDVMLQKLVEDFFPSARAFREGLEKQRSVSGESPELAPVRGSAQGRLQQPLKAGYP